jgi:hypothetical protein
MSVRATSHGAADHCRTHRQNDGRDQRIEEGGIGDEFNEIRDGEAAVAVMNAVIDEPGQRQQDQEAQRHRKSQQDRQRHVEPERRTPC